VKCIRQCLTRYRFVAERKSWQNKNDTDESGLLQGCESYNKAQDCFRSQNRLMWLFAAEDTFVRNAATGQYQYSQVFINKQKDLRCLTVTSDFSERFPELRQDIPCFDQSYSNDRPLLSSVKDRVRITDVTNDESKTTSRENELFGPAYLTIPPILTGQVNTSERLIVPQENPACM
jgi:hypothetical protein